MSDEHSQKPTISEFIPTWPETAKPEEVIRRLDVAVENFELAERLQKAEVILEELGYRRCDIAACNCGGYHRTCEEPEV